MKNKFTAFVIASMVGGVLVGWAINGLAEADQARAIADGLSIVTDVFLRLVKMIIAPLVFTTLVAGIAHMEDAAAIGRVGAKTMAWFIGASVVSLIVGLIMVNLIQPGAGLHLVLPVDHGAAANAGTAAASFTFRDFLSHLVPTSIVKAMADNEILQIVVFSLFVGAAVAAIDDRAPAVLTLVEQVAAIMLKVTGYVMKTAPLAVFAALAATVATQGLAVLVSYGKFILGFYASLGILWILLTIAMVLVVGRRGWKLASDVRHPVLLAFSTASSEAAYPQTLDALQKWGVSRKVASFVLPLGYSFNLDGSTMYCAFATMFIAQIYGIELSIGQQIAMMALLMVTTKGIASVPRASLVVIAATLTFFNLPEAGLLLILAIDHILDMGRSATNVLGNSVASAVVAKWENEIRQPVSDGQAAGGERASPAGRTPIHANQEAIVLPDRHSG